MKIGTLTFEYHAYDSISGYLLLLNKKHRNLVKKKAEIEDML